MWATKIHTQLQNTLYEVKMKIEESVTKKENDQQCEYTGGGGGGVRGRGRGREKEGGKGRGREKEGAKGEGKREGGE